jgi:hypothetical protein
LIFYEQLMQQQAQNLKAMIVKVEAEATQFDDYHNRDDELVSDYLTSLPEGTTEDAVAARAATHHAASALLDEEVRRSLALYANAAKWNGYSYQAYLMREKVLPENRATLAGVEEELATYQGIKATILSPPMLAHSNKRWNWKQRADAVGMGAQYDFLYSFTSKLLHSTPMNLITDKSLSGDEARTMLEYCYTAFQDLIEGINGFDFPGRMDLVVLDLDELEVTGATE